MNTISGSRADVSLDDAGQKRVLVWDVPVRVFHWLMVLCFAGAWLTAESEQWRLLHVTLGYTMAGLVGFRLVWGLVGTQHARFSSFVRGPAAAMRYLRSLLRGKPEHHTGHNPAGALAIIALLLLTIAITALGWATYNEVGGEWLEEAHEAAATIMLALVGVHVAGVAIGSLMHRENLVRAMIDGRKTASGASGTSGARGLVGVLLLAAVLGFWWLQWRDAPSAVPQADRPAVVGRQHHDDD